MGCYGRSCSIFVHGTNSAHGESLKSLEGSWATEFPLGSGIILPVVLESGPLRNVWETNLPSARPGNVKSNLHSKEDGEVSTEEVYLATVEVLKPEGSDGPRAFFTYNTIRRRD